jgi:MoaA/NifB/PqqE/SkfB family radical SAM enzyme
MRFPALLSAKLAKARLAALFSPTHRAPLVDFIDAAEVLHPGSAHPVSHQKIRGILDSPAPVLWIGGSEPLEHPGIAHFIRAIAQSGRFIFLETRGGLLRRRIHEFQPTPRFFLTIRFDAAPSIRREPRHSAAFELALEGIRAARLSGFFTAAHVLLNEDSNLSRLHDFASILAGLDLDAWLMTSATSTHAAIQKASEARALIPNALWRRFSEQLERELLAASKPCDIPNASTNEKQSAHPCEESAHIA